MKLRTLIACGLMLLGIPTVQADPTFEQLDSLFSAYDKASTRQRAALGKTILGHKVGMDNLQVDLPTLTDRLPADSVDYLVWFAADRFYISSGHFREALAYIDRALPSAAGNSPFLHATLLCDRGYCLYKLSRSDEAGQTEREAEQLSRKHKLWQPLARSYNYMAIINIGIGHFDEAKHFVEKAIETDRLTGNNLYTHNYFGVACEVYTVANEPKPAVSYGVKAVEAARALGDSSAVVNHLSQLSYAYNRNGQLDKALRTSLYSLEAVQKLPVPDLDLQGNCLEYVAFNLLDLKRNAEAVPYVEQAIALGQKQQNWLSVCYDYKYLAEALEPDRPREAMKALRRYSAMMDSIHNSRLAEALGQANAELHNDDLKDQFAQSQYRSRLITIVSVVSLLVLLAVIAALVYISRLRQRTRLATEHLLAVRETFFTNVTHEFRTPLTIILGLARQLLQQVPEQQKSLLMIERNGEQLLTLVNQLLDITKVKAAAVLTPEAQQGNISLFVGMVVDRYRPLAEQKQVTLDYQPQASDMPTAYVPDYVEKIVANLLSNALKFTPEGGRVSLDMQADSRLLTLRVSDTGQGILPDDLPHVFEPFYQGRNNTLTGTGVGLALVSQLVEALQGHVAVESQPGQGTTFTVTLPRPQRVGSTVATPSPTTHLSSRSSGVQEFRSSGVQEFRSSDNSHANGSTLNSQSPLTSQLSPLNSNNPLVLIVEDNPDVADYIGSLMAHDFRLIYAPNGAVGMQMALEHVPDLIVTDVMMPDTDGLELCRQLRASDVTNHIPIIVITARATDDDRLQGIDAGADAYLSKPFRADELLLRADKLLQQRALLQQKWQQDNGYQPATAESADQLCIRSAGVQEFRSSDNGLANSSTCDAKPSTLNSQLSARPAGTLSPSEATERTFSAQFLERLDAIILRQMTSGDTEAEAIASAVNMSLSQFSRKLRAMTGITPAAYITAIRIGEAKRMLVEEPQSTISEVAYHCGYADVAHFSHAFRRVVGCSPTEFKKKAAF